MLPWLPWKPWQHEVKIQVCICFQITTFKAAVKQGVCEVCVCVCVCLGVAFFRLAFFSHVFFGVRDYCMEKLTVL